MSLNPEDFKTLDIKVSSDKATVEVVLEAHPAGYDLYDEDKNIYIPNPDYKKWRPTAVIAHLKSLGHDVERHLGGTNKVVTNGDHRLSATMVFQLKKRPTRIKASKNEKPKPVTKKEPDLTNAAKTSTAPKRRAPRKKKEQ
tara:strand:- start:4634 stop:5056 length:423 start_codon:yes stop_codon:yes gene_type:complete